MKLKMKDNPSSEELRKLILKNNTLFSETVKTILNDRDSWSIQDSKQFIYNLMSQASINTQNLFNAYVDLNSSLNNSSLNNNLDLWLNTLIDSTVINLVLILSLTDMDNEQSKSALFTALYEILNIAGAGNKPVIH